MGISRSRENTMMMTMTMVISDLSTRLRIYFATVIGLLDKGEWAKPSHPGPGGAQMPRGSRGEGPDRRRSLLSRTRSSRRDRPGSGAAAPLSGPRLFARGGGQSGVALLQPGLIGLLKLLHAHGLLQHMLEFIAGGGKAEGGIGALRG